MVAEEKALRKQIAKMREGDPSNSAATFAEISFEAEIEAGAQRAIAAAKWFDNLTRRKS